MSWFSQNNFPNGILNFGSLCIKGSKMTETKCATETVVAAEFHPLEAGVIVSVGKGHVNFWTLDNTTLTLSRKTGLFDLRDKPKYVTCLAFSFTG